AVTGSRAPARGVEQGGQLVEIDVVVLAECDRHPTTIPVAVSACCNLRRLRAAAAEEVYHRRAVAAAGTVIAAIGGGSTTAEAFTARRLLAFRAQIAFPPVCADSTLVVDTELVRAAVEERSQAIAARGFRLGCARQIGHRGRQIGHRRLVQR